MFYVTDVNKITTPTTEMEYKGSFGLYVQHDKQLIGGYITIAIDPLNYVHTSYHMTNESLMNLISNLMKGNNHVHIKNPIEDGCYPVTGEIRGLYHNPIWDYTFTFTDNQVKEILEAINTIKYERPDWNKYGYKPGAIQITQQYSKEDDIRKINRAIKFATDVHAGQTDKAGQPYIDHLFRVSLTMEDTTHGIVALLHDTIEDTKTTKTELQELFGNEVADAVDAMSRRKNETYYDFILRCRRNPISRHVKLADLRDNMNLGRLPEITPKDLERLSKYETATVMLTEDALSEPFMMSAKEQLK